MYYYLRMLSADINSWRFMGYDIMMTKERG